MTDRDQPRLFTTPPRYVRRMRRGTDESLRALKQAGQLEDVDAGLRNLLRTLADQLDAVLEDDEPNRWTLWRGAAEWRATFAELRGAPGGALDAELAAFLAGGADDPAAVRDTPEP